LGERRSHVRPHLLIVGDDPDLASFLAEGLLLAGFWTSTVASPFQVLEVFRLRSFDLVLIDAALGGFGAIELVRRLRGRSDRSPSGGQRTDIPIILVAAGSAEVGSEAVTGSGADGLLVAPLDLEEIAPRIFRVVEAWRQSHPDRPWADEVALASNVRPPPV
jgi:DNA-binding response OmpR family regulator